MDVFSHNFPNCLAQDCPFYPRISQMQVVGYFGGFEQEIHPTPEDYLTLFHKECNVCITDESDVLSLCQYCQHLRVRHLFICSWRQQWPRIPIINHGPLEDIIKRRECRICRVIARLYTEALPVEDQLDDQPTVLLRPNTTERAPFLTLADTGIDMELTGFGVSLLQTVLPLTRYAIVQDLLETESSKNTEERLKSLQTSGQMVNWPQVRTWMRYSTLHHPLLSNQAPGLDAGVPVGFRLIDVEGKCVVSTSTFPKFAALSYVWGKRRPDEIENQRSNSEELSRRNSLCHPGIPKTISDAMIACKQLEIPYLWVDRLCIVQDDEAEKYGQIQAMGTIYARSFVTICAAAGEDAHYGLPGVAARQRKLYRQNERLDTLEIAPVLPNQNDCLRSCTWSTRGWTYQELVLSTRLLIFTEWQLFFRCSNMTTSEDSLTLFGDWNIGPLLADARTYEKERESPFYIYASCISGYSDRKLSHVSDIYNAISGIFGMVYPRGDRFWYGLPEKDFDAALLWVPNNEKFSLGVTFLPTTRSPRTDGVSTPSWSWASETCRAHYFNADSVGSVATWMVQDEEEVRRKIRATNDSDNYWKNGSNNFESSKRSAHPDDKVLSPHGPRDYMLAAWPLCIEASVPRYLEQERRSMAPRTWLSERWPTYEHFWQEAHENRDLNVSEATTNLLNSEHARLLVRTSVAWARLFRHTAFGIDNRGNLEVHILDKNGWPMGTCRMPIPAAEAHMRITRSGSGAGMVCLLALSVTYANEGLLDDLSGKEYEPIVWNSNTKWSPRTRPERPHRFIRPIETDQQWTCSDNEGTSIHPPPALNVMIVGWRGQVAYRVCIGVVLLSRWNHCDPTFQTIVLE